ncbi:MAG: NrfD/PsrC family molybdoenzyme membrane anchor subunit [Candidatus Promineifilaceae bacterium]|jgi:molybdopterin-containing oxidoreductase family membrane subunit
MATGQIAIEQPKRVNALTLWYILIAVMISIGLWGAYNVLRHGLGVTNLTDQVPWGLWITHDLSAIGLGAGAFAFSAIAYLFRYTKFQEIARAAVYVGFIGYTSAMIALAMDIGRPDRFYHPLIFWNVHSVLWEITWCVILYSTILFFEFLPVLLESPMFDRWPRLRVIGDYLHKLTPVFAVMGLALSLLHQSSLGATYGVLSGREIWYKPTMPVMFIVSAVAAGTSLTLFLTLVAGAFMNRELISEEVKMRIARFSGYAMLAYLYLKLWDWAATSYYSHAPGTADALLRLELTTPYSRTFWVFEVLLGALIPAVIFLYPGFRRNDRLLIIAAGLAVFGLVVNRWNVTLSGLVVPPVWSPGRLGQVVVYTYFPSLVEIAVTIGIIGYGFLMFTLGVRHLPLYPKIEEEDAH